MSNKCMSLLLLGIRKFGQDKSLPGVSIPERLPPELILESALQPGFPNHLHKLGIA